MTTYNQLKYPASSIGNSSIATGAVSPDKLDSNAQRMGFKNRIINGAMVIDQRNAGASVTVTGESYTLDRWATQANQTSKFSVQQNAGSVTPPVGFTNYLGATSLSAYSVLAGDYFTIEQRIEGYNVADLDWGTANAKTVTLSFWVRSSLTGSFGGSFTNSGNSRSYPFTYTISSANTWEQKSITIAGDTTGTWLKTIGQGIDVYFSLGMGSTRTGTAGAWAAGNYLSATGATSVVGTSGATFYITGVQLEVGSTASSFDYRPYGTELALCQRYYQKSYVTGTAVGTATSTNALRWFPDATSSYASYFTMYPVVLRSAPTITLYSTTGAVGKIRNADSGTDINGQAPSGTSSIHIYVNGVSVSTSTTLMVHFTASSEL